MLIKGCVIVIIKKFVIVEYGIMMLNFVFNCGLVFMVIIIGRLSIIVKGNGVELIIRM